VEKKIIHVIIASPQQSDLRYRRHRLAEYLSKQDDSENVFWVSPEFARLVEPMDHFKIRRRARKGFDAAGDKGIIEFSMPGHSSTTYMDWGRFLCASYTRKLKAMLVNRDARKVLWFTSPVFPFMATMIGWDLTVYDCSDFWAASTAGSTSMVAGINSRIKRKSEQSIIEHSDVILATSSYLAEQVERESGRMAIIIENGVDFQQFAAMGRSRGDDLLSEIPRPRLGFVGGLKEKIDFSVMREMADRHPEWNIVLVGPKLSGSNELNGLLRRDNVFWVGSVDSEEVPAYLRCLDVGLLPYRDIDYNKGVFPLKLFEYLAVGLPVVGCGVPSTARYAAGDTYTLCAGDVFVEACENALAMEGCDEGRASTRRVELARQADWEVRFRQIMNIVRNRLAETGSFNVGDRDGGCM